MLNLNKPYAGVWAGLFFILSFVHTVSAEQPQELKGEHFIVYSFQKGDLAKDVMNKAEVYYRRIAQDLGYARYSEFWSWDKRVKIYIYPDHKSFLEETGQPEWSQGMADYKKKYIAGFAGSGSFLDSLLPHEIAHLIFRDFVGFKGEVPLWLDEGVAQWAEEEKRRESKLMVRRLLEKGLLLSLEDMMTMDIRNANEDLVNTYYMQSVSVVGFLIDKYGSARFIDFCRQLRDGKSMNEALRLTYTVFMADTKGLESRWREYLKEVR